jgi:hypothetical protein
VVAQWWTFRVCLRRRIARYISGGHDLFGALNTVLWYLDLDPLGAFPNSGCVLIGDENVKSCGSQRGTQQVRLVGVLKLGYGYDPFSHEHQLLIEEAAITREFLIVVLDRSSG